MVTAEEAAILKGKSQSMRKAMVGASVYDLAKERVHHCYDLFDHVSVSFSGGKDSTAVLNVCLEVAKERGKLPLHVVFYDEEAIPYEIERYVRRVSQRPDVKLDWYCIPLSHTNACSSTQTSWITWNPEEKEKWVRPMPPEAKTSMDGYDPALGVLTIPQLNGILFPLRYGTVGWMMGIRAAESLTRYQAVSRREDENYIVKLWGGEDFGGASKHYGNVYKCMPIYDWEVEDVWTAPALYGWDYSEAYDIMEMAGIKASAQRVAPPYGTQPMRSLWMFKECFPDVWDKICKRVDGANTAAMYGRTDLYGSGVIEKPADKTWLEFITDTLNSYDDLAAKAKVAKFIRKYIRTHEKKLPGVPILDHVSHPFSGVSWELLAKIAIRKDAKGRIRPDMKQVSFKDKVRYDKAVAEHAEALRLHYANQEEKGRL